MIFLATPFCILFSIGLFLYCIPTVLYSQFLYCFASFLLNVEAVDDLYGGGKATCDNAVHAV